MYRYRYHCSTGVVGKMAHLTLLGFGILFLGPVALGLVATVLALVLGVVAAALPFVVIGALGYGPYVMARRMLGYPRQRVVEVRKIPPPRRVVPEVPRVPPVSAAVELPLIPIREEPRPRPQGVVVRVLKEVFCGALVGGVLGTVAVMGAASDWQVTGRVLDCAAMGAGIGAVVGFVVGGPRPTRTEKTAAVG